MNKKHFYPIVILLLFLAASVQPVRAVISVPSQTTIVVDGQTVTIATWHTPERIYTLTADVSQGLVITESDLTLNGDNYTITGSGSGNGILLSGRTGVTVKNVTLSGFANGIYLDCSNYNKLSGNTISNHTASSSEGVGLHWAEHNIINANTIQNNYNGIVFANDSHDNKVYDNDFSSNTERQAYLVAGDNNQIYNNNFYGEGTKYQVHVGGGSNNAIYYNNLYGNDIYFGVDTIQLYASGGANKIYNNNFIRGESTSLQVYADNFGNEFNLGLPTGGNYWSDKTGPDVEEPFGIVDAPYTFWVGTQGDIDQDDFPWVQKDGWSTPSPPTPEEALVELIAKVEALNGEYGISNALDAKLQNALDALEAKNAGQRQDAINKMQAFINAVEAQSGNKIPVEIANDLIADANYIISLL